MKTHVLALLTTIAIGGSAYAFPPKAQKAPELVQGAWINTSHPLTLVHERGRVVILTFWTFDCINCRHNLPALARIQKHFQGVPVDVIGVLTPETAEEHSLPELRRVARKLGATFPTVQDNSSKNWDNYHQEYWPTVYVIDQAGFIRREWVGELNYDGQSGEQEVDNLVHSLLNRR